MDFLSPTIVFAAGTALAPVINFLKTEALTELAKSAVGKAGGKLASVVGRNTWQVVIERWTAGQLPPNHDIAKASRAALGHALQWMAHELSGQTPPELRGEILQRLMRGEVASQISQLAVPVEYTTWAKALIALARDDDALKALELRQLSGGEVQQLLQTQTDGALADELHQRTRAWLDKQLHGKGSAPDQLADFLSTGWPVPPDSAMRVTLYQAWCLFFREAIKKDPKVFNSFTAAALADLLQRTAPAGAAPDYAALFATQLEAPLGELLTLARRTWETTARVDLTTQRVEEKVDTLLGLARRQAAFEWPRAKDFSVYLADRAQSFAGRDWLTTRVLGWLRQPAEDARQALLILAPFGVGKSAFMASLVSRLAQEKLAVAIHFCRFDEQDTLQPGKIIKSLAAQFRDLLPGYQAAVEGDQHAQQALASAESDPALAWSRAVVDPLVGLGRPGEGQLLVLVIDGLDESLELHNAESEEGGSLLDMILKGTAGRLPRWVRIVASSREVPQLQAQIQRFKTVQMLEGAGLENRKDLEAFIRGRARGGRLQQLIQGAAMDETSFVSALGDLCDGKFLLAHYLLDDAEAQDFDSDDLRAVLRRSREIPSMDAYYEWVFDKRLRRALVDRAKTRAVLGLVAVALDPLPEGAIAEVLREDAITEDEVGRIVAAFGGLLRHDDQAGVTFDHLSIEQWLDKSRQEGRTRAGHAKAGPFAIEREQTMARLQAHCSRMAGLAYPAMGEFGRYLGKHGVVHLIDAGELAAALSLLLRLPLDAAARPRGRGAPPQPAPPRRLESRVIDAIQDRLRAFDEAFHRDEALPAQWLEGLAVAHLHRLLASRDYETGKYQPILRTLIQFKGLALGDVQARYSAVLASDLVFRYDLGVAYADAWFYSQGADKTRLLGEIVAMAQDAGADLREAAGYALKHICQKIDPRPWWLDIQPTMRELAARYALSDDVVDRLVAGEMLLALALQGVQVRGWFAGLDGEARFWQPAWPNLRMDIEAICVHTGSDMAWRGPLPEAVRLSVAAAQAQADRAAALAAGFEHHPLFAEGASAPNLHRLHWAVGSLQDQQCDKVALDLSLDALAELVDRPDCRPLIFDVVCRLMLHPSWDLTESGASLVADLIKRKGRSHGPWWLIDDLLASDLTHWRLLYGAVDAAYNAGGVDGYQKFKQALVTVGHLKQCRVRGICADDLRMWVKQASLAQKREILADPAIRGLLQCWLETADDTWLLEYLHLLFSELWTGSDSVPDLVVGLMPGRLSHYLRLDPDRPFYAQPADRFLAAIEAQSQAEWQGLS